MNYREQYTPGPANAAVRKDEGEKWAIILVRDLRHPPERVWQALTDPAHLREWAPFDVDGPLDTVGATVKLTWVGTEWPIDTTVLQADPPRVLEYSDIRWDLEPSARGTHLTLSAKIDRRYVAMGAAGWHVALDVLDQYIAGTPIGRIAGKDAMQFEGWQRLKSEYAKQFAGE